MEEIFKLRHNNIHSPLVTNLRLDPNPELSDMKILLSSYTEQGPFYTAPDECLLDDLAMNFIGVR